MAILAIVSMVLILSCGSGASAEEFHLVPIALHPDTLTGDWGGLRTELAAKGVEIAFSYYGDTFGLVSDGVKRQTRYATLLEPSVAIDLEKLIGWRNAKLFVLGIGTYGADPVEAAGSIHAPSNLAANETFKVFEAWLEQHFLIIGWRCCLVCTRSMWNSMSKKLLGCS